MKKFFFVIQLFFSLNTFGQHKNEYINPILAGFYPDPSICKTGDDYYLVNSTFAYFPGLPIFHSKDLVNWKQIGFAMDRPEQLDLEGAGVSRGLFAPTIRYHDGLYYIVCTLIDRGGNFIITAKDPAGPWSNPTWLKEIDGIDPSLFFDEDDKARPDDQVGRAYFIYNSIPPGNKSLWDGHRTIRMRAFDYKNLKVTGEEKLIINGGTDISKKPVWIEGPHVYKINGLYYLLCAEGGTGYNHSEVVFRSKTVEGPYASYENNPILTQRDLDPKRADPITTTGHADLVETPGGWYAVFLGCRPYEDNHYNIGRETFMAPVQWKDGWPIINPDYKEVQYHYPFPFSSTKKYTPKYSGNFLYRDDFNKTNLDYNWQFLRTPKEMWYSLSEQNGLMIKLLPQTCSGKNNPAFLGHRQQHLKGYASTSLNFSATSQNEKAGMLIFQNENHFYFLCKSIKDNKPVIQLYKSIADNSGKMELLQSQKLLSAGKLKLKIEANGNTYSFYYSDKKRKWNLLKAGVDAKFLSTKVAGGFVGCMYALYASSYGTASTAKAYFNWFEYKGNDDVYKNGK